MAETDATIARVAVKIPDFTSSDLELWFAMVEGSFTSAGVTIDSTKFGYVVGALPPKYAVEVKDIIMTPPSDTTLTTYWWHLFLRKSTSYIYRSFLSVYANTLWLSIQKNAFLDSQK
jgi:hypothetical protein